MKNLRGSLLIEALIAISIIVVVVALGSQMVVVSIRSNKNTGDRTVAIALIDEIYEATSDAAATNWLSIYKPPDGTGDASTTKGSANKYYPLQSSGQWTIASGTTSTLINGITYTRYFNIDNVSRDVSTRDIESSYNSGHDDPSTQKITVTVSWPAETATSSQFITRWRNKACGQTDWSGGTSASTSSCPTTAYGSDDGHVDESVSGQIKLKSQ